MSLIDSGPSPYLRSVRLTGVFLLISLLLAAALPVFAADIQSVNPQLESQLMKQGDKAFRRADLDIAESTFRQIIVINPNNTRAKLRLSHTLFKKRILLDAYYLAFDVGKAEPDNDYAYALAGNILLALGNFKGAYATLYVAYQKNPDNALTLYGLGMLDFYNNRLEDSLRKLDAAAFLDTNEPDYIVSFAQVSARLERYKQAAEAYRIYLRIAPQSDLERRERIKGLIDFLEFLGTKSKLYDLGGEDQTRIAIELINDRPIIKLRAGNRDEEFRFVIDTGSNITVISQKTAERLKMKPVARGGTARGVGGDGKFEIIYGFLPSLSIGDVKVRNVPVYLRQFPEGVGKYDGYLGLAMLSKFLTTIDFGDNTLTMTRNRRDANSPPPEVAENEFVSNLRLTPSGFLSGEVTLPGVELPLNFIVDTGAELSVISTDLAQREGIKPFIRAQTMRVVGAAGVTDGVPLFHLPSVSIGTNSVQDVRAIALNLSLINENAGFEQSGILGGNFLKHYRLKFDFQNYTLSFTPIDPAMTTARE